MYTSSLLSSEATSCEAAIRLDICRSIPGVATLGSNDAQYRTATGSCCFLHTFMASGRVSPRECKNLRNSHETWPSSVASQIFQQVSSQHPSSVWKNRDRLSNGGMMPQWHRTTIRAKVAANEITPSSVQNFAHRLPSRTPLPRLL